MTFEEKQHELVFTARMNILMHQDLELFYAFYTRWTSTLSLLFSSAAFASIASVFPAWIPFQKDALIASFAFIITIMNAIQLAFSFPTKLQTHATFRRKWTEVELQLKLLNEDSENAFFQLLEIEKKTYQLHGDEPPVSKGRRKKAYFAAISSLGLESPVEIPLLYRN